MADVTAMATVFVAGTFSDTTLTIGRYDGPIVLSFFTSFWASLGQLTLAAVQAEYTDQGDAVHYPTARQPCLGPLNSGVDPL